MKIHHAIAALVAASLVARRYAALIIASDAAFVSADKRLRRLVAGEKLPIVKARHSARPRRSWFVYFQAHIN